MATCCPQGSRRYRHRQVNLILAPGIRDIGGDLYGDGLADWVSFIGCRFGDPKQSGLEWPRCHALTATSPTVPAGGDWGPAFFPGPPGQQLPTSTRALLVNETLGVARASGPGSEGVSPDMLSMVTAHSGLTGSTGTVANSFLRPAARWQWNYATLAGAAGRAPR